MNLRSEAEGRKNGRSRNLNVDAILQEERAKAISLGHKRRHSSDEVETTLWSLSWVSRSSLTRRAS